MKPATVSGHAAYEVESLDAVVEGDSAYIRHTLTLSLITGDTAYSVAATSEPADWDGVQALARKIIYSFQPGSDPNVTIRSEPVVCEDLIGLKLEAVSGEIIDTLGTPFVRISGDLINECANSVVVVSILGVVLNANKVVLAQGECIDNLGMRVYPQQSARLDCWVFLPFNIVDEPAGVDLILALLDPSRPVE